MKGSAGVVSGIFQRKEAAAHAVDGLVQAHFDPRIDLSVIASHRHQREKVPVRVELRIGRGAALGAAVGAALSAVVVAFLGLSYGPLTHFAAGPVYAVLEGAFLGASVGFGAGALLGLDLRRVRAEFDEVHVPHGAVVCVVVRAHGERARRARQILTDAGAKHFICADETGPSPIAAREGARSGASP